MLPNVDTMRGWYFQFFHTAFVLTVSFCFQSDKLVSLKSYLMYTLIGTSKMRGTRLKNGCVRKPKCTRKNPERRKPENREGLS